jgi:hypothetical protein
MHHVISVTGPGAGATPPGMAAAGRVARRSAAHPGGDTINTPLGRSHAVGCSGIRTALAPCLTSVP